MIKTAVLGLGFISRRVIAGILAAENTELYAVVSRNQEKANQFKDEFGARKAYDFQRLLNDEEVDLVYVCTPTPNHYENLVELLNHKKNVICEKPMVMSIEKTKELFALARKNHCFLMQALKQLFVPLNIEVKKQIREGLIGEIKHIDAAYTYANPFDETAKNTWVYTPGDGGVAGDVGIYAAAGVYDYMDGDEIETIQISKKYEYGVDFDYNALIRFKSGASAVCVASWYYVQPGAGRMKIFGTKGLIEIPFHWKARDAYVTMNDGSEFVIHKDMVSDFEGEIFHAADCVEKGLIESPVNGEKQTIDILRMMTEE